MPVNEFESRAARQRMIQLQIRDRGVHDPRVLDAMMEIPREAFLPLAQRHTAYEDRALALTAGQTISQPFIVAYMTERLDVQPHHRVLEIGTGSGYQCAVLSRLAKHVYSIERIDELKDRAARALAELGCTNVTLRVGDGTLGWPEFAPFDRIMVTAGGPQVPPALVEQLANGGRLVIPIGGEAEQTITIMERAGDRVVETPSLACRFVKLIGQEGWQDET